MPDQGRPLVTERQQKVAEAAGEAAERVVAAARRRSAVAGKSGAITVWFIASGSITGSQGAGAGHAVDQQQDGAGTRFDEVHGAAVDLDRPGPCLGHAQPRHLACHGRNVPTEAVEVSQERGFCDRFQYCRAVNDAPQAASPQSDRPPAAL